MNRARVSRWGRLRVGAVAVAVILAAAGCANGASRSEVPTLSGTAPPVASRTTLPVTTTSTLPTTHPVTSSTAPLPVVGQWVSMPAGPVARSEYVSVWTGEELLVWGNPLGPAETQATGDIFDPSKGVWRPMAPAPEARRSPAAVWTGSRMLIWGGDRAMGDSTVPDLADDGFAYDPATDTWSLIPAAPIAGRCSMFNVWTGTELIVWGGMVDHDGMYGAVGDGAAYDPATNTWRVLAPSPLGGKDPGVGVWTGHEMIIGGNGDATDGDLGWASYDPVTDSWSEIPDPPGVRSSSVYVGVWTGTEVLFSPFGVPDQPAPLAAYNPRLGEWRLTALPPVNLSAVPAVWTGSWVVFWGHTVAGMPGVAPMAGVVYDPAADTWERLAPDSLGTRWVGSLVATGDGVIVWGGQSYRPYGASSTPLHDDGAILVLPPSRALAPTSTTTTAPSTTTTYGAQQEFSVFSNGFFPDPLPGSNEANGSGCVVSGSQLPDGIWFGFVEDAGAATVTFDLACFWTGEAAAAEAAADGQEPLEGDFHIRDEDPQTRTVARDSAGTAYWLDGAGDLTPQAIPMSDWPVIGGTAYQECPGDHCAAWLYVNGGVVTELVEQYLP
ncbi:kelch motif protein [bacterium BMS3Abin02]|nr:kelch motif protein [bacterium BMS3Abin02]